MSRQRSAELNLYRASAKPRGPVKFRLHVKGALQLQVTDLKHCCENFDHQQMAHYFDSCSIDHMNYQYEPES